jgi:hypothetical protein
MNKIEKIINKTKEKNIKTKIKKKEKKKNKNLFKKGPLFLPNIS